jgi:hypothetical protein
MMNRALKMSVFLLAAIFAWVVLYASWYSINRSQAIARDDACARSGRACPTDTIPPTFWEMVTNHHGQIGPVGVSQRLDPYGNGCDQSATTTDCSKLDTLSQTPPEVYVPPNFVSPIAEWESATDTPLAIGEFSFMLPVGWHGSVYDTGNGSQNVLIESYQNGPPGFTVDCPPFGKGMEAARLLSNEERSLVHDRAVYTLAFEKWSAPGNDPWLFVRIQKEVDNDTPILMCLVQGSFEPNIVTAMHTLYKTLRVKE